MYLKYRTRSDIAFVVEQLSQHNSNSRAGYFRIAQQVLCYNSLTDYKVLASRPIFTTHSSRIKIAQYLYQNSIHIFWILSLLQIIYIYVTAAI